MDTLDLQRLKTRYDIIGDDAALNRALEIAMAVSRTDQTVLISGESGVGKEVIPKIIHQNSARKGGKYLAVNCGAIPESTINAELFGHEKGAFTGAIAERKGYFEEANGGTIFLDEIGELPKDTQAMLLRVLQSGEYMKVGSSKVEKTDVRVICATNVNLPFAVSEGKFRGDLYYRINAIEIRVPALRERKEDICLLFRKFSSDFAERFRLCKPNLTHEAIGALTSYRWPGNVRQLKNVAESLVTMESNPLTPQSARIDISAAVMKKYIPEEQDTLLPQVIAANTGNAGINDSDKQMILQAIVDLKKDVERLKSIVASGGMTVTAPETQGYREEEPEEQISQDPEEESLNIGRSKDEMMEKALAKHGGDVPSAAKELGVSERTVYRFIKKQKNSRK